MPSSFDLRYLAIPARVPPVPHAHINASNRRPLVETISMPFAFDAKSPHCRQISGPVPSRCERKFAVFSNWSAKYPAPRPLDWHNSSARRLATFTKWSLCVMDTGRTRSTVAPNDSISRGFSIAASSGNAKCALHPSALATIASDTPVLPAVPSVTVPPSTSSPESSASVMILSATRSFTLPPGLANSHLIITSHPVAAERELTRIKGVLPMDASTSGMGGGGGK
mmetsp:Transcript_9617/g.37539  ORF Transcript_9617/g.37539 Transcript_9617/m.37539 type:complete len:225 (-) Transcript_9617:243-917(-)